MRRARICSSVIAMRVVALTALAGRSRESGPGGNPFGIVDARGQQFSVRVRSGFQLVQENAVVTPAINNPTTQTETIHIKDEELAGFECCAPRPYRASASPARTA